MLNDNQQFQAIIGVKAKYTKQLVLDYRGNPLIEALPPIFSKDEAVDYLTVLPPYDPQERLLPAHYRYHCLWRIFKYFQPWTRHLELEASFSRSIRQGLLKLNPLLPDYARRLQKGYEAIKRKDFKLLQREVNECASTGMTLIGVSGLGKSRTLQRILSAYTQVIIHSRYKGKPLWLVQLTWIKIDCPPDGLLSGLCNKFFLEVDRLLGTTYCDKAKSDKIDVLQAKIAQYARLHCLGVLVIDEIQHLSLQGSGGRDKMMNFLVSLVNEIGISVILIGTNKATTILNRQFRMAKRASGMQGEFIWDRLQNDGTWQLLIEGMWEYQWTQKVIPFTKELTDCLYYESQGIVDVAIKLFAMAQLRAITTGVETINEEMIRVVAADGLKLIKPMLDAYKSGRIADLAKYEDLKPVDFEEFFEENKPKVDVFDTLKKRKLLEEKNLKDQKRSVREELILKLLDLKLDPKIVAQVLEDVLAEMEDETSDVSLMLQEALKRIFSQPLGNNLPVATGLVSKGNIKKSQAKNLKENKPELKPILELIVEDGMKENMPANDALCQKGYIQLLLRE